MPESAPPATRSRSDPISTACGVIDFRITDAAGHTELSRSRLFPLQTGGCVLIHLAVRWDGADDALWAAHKAGTDADLAHARRVLEAECSGPAV